jgi:proteasome alpha subunit
MPENRVIVSDELNRYMNTIVQKGIFGSKAELIRASLIRYIETLPVRIPSGYDNVTVFSPDGRLFQVEYALESANRGTTIVGLRYNDGVILAKEKPGSKEITEFPYTVTGPWEDFQIDQNIGIVPTGLIADYILLKHEAKKEAQSHKKETGEPITVEELTIKLSLILHGYTMKRKMRPLGCVLLIGGVDKTGCHLFLTDPSGAYKEVLASCGGSKMKEVNDLLKDDYQTNLPFNEALGLTIKAILKDETRRPEEITVAVIETETKTLRKITLDEIKKTWETAT